MIQQNILVILERELLKCGWGLQRHGECKARWLVHNVWIGKKDMIMEEDYKEDSRNSKINHRRFLGNVQFKVELSREFKIRRLLDD